MAVTYVFVCGDLFRIQDFGIFEDEPKKDKRDDWIGAGRVLPFLLVLSDDPTARAKAERILGSFLRLWFSPGSRVYDSLGGMI